MGKGVPRLPDINTMLAASINPKTGLPFKFTGVEALKDNIKRVLRVIDEQNAIGRYKWFNLPDTIDGELLERVLYYRGQGMFFYMETDNSFYFLPFALSKSIDVYGRYTGVTPLPFNGSAESKEAKPWIVGLNRKPVYGVKYDELKYEDLTESCVLLYDYTKQISQTTIPRQQLNEGIIDVEAECIPFMRTAMILGTGVKGMRVSGADEVSNVEIASKSIENAALTGKPWVPILGNIEFQELTDASNMKGADYMQAMQSIDNLRLSTYGLDNGGLFEKKAHMLESEQATMGGAVSIVYQDGLRIRQNFCNIVNSIWNLGIWCEASDASMGGDVNGDGLGYDEQDPMTATNDNGGADYADDSSI